MIIVKKALLYLWHISFKDTLKYVLMLVTDPGKFLNSAADFPSFLALIIWVIIQIIGLSSLVERDFNFFTIVCQLFLLTTVLMAGYRLTIHFAHLYDDLKEHEQNTPPN